MTSKLYIKRGGALSFETEVTDMTGRQGAPFFDGQQPLVNLGMRYADGESSQGNFLLNDPDAVIHDATYRLVPHGLVTWTEDASGDELWLARNRIAPLESGRRGPYIAYRDIEWNVQTLDCNIDLTGNHFVEEWVRPAETDIERIIALQGYILDGEDSTAPKHRRSTDITCSTSHLLNDDTTYDMPAKTYPAGTVARDVLQDIAERAGKLYGVVIHHLAGESHLCLLYIQETDHTTYRTGIKISQRVVDWDPDHATAPVVEPIWDRGKGTRTDNDGVISGLVSIWGGTNDEPNVIFVDQPDDEDPYEFWTDSFFDSDSENETEATNRANAILAARRAPGHRTHQLSIKLHPDQTQLICAGMSIEVKSVVVSPNDPMAYVERRITELRWEPSFDGDYWAHIDLDLPLRRARVRGGSGQPVATTPKPPPECEPPDPDFLPSDALAADWRTGDPMRVDPVTDGAAAPPWGSIGQDCTPIASWAVGCRTRVGGGQASQWFEVTSGGDVTVSFAVARVGSPDAVQAATIQWDIGGGATQNVQMGYCGQDTIAGWWRYHSLTFAVPVGATYAKFTIAPHACIGYLFAGTPAVLEECPPDSIPPGSGGTSPYYARSDDPRFDADDQHLTTALKQRVTNNSGGALVAGDVVIPDVTFDGQGVTTTTDAAQTDYRMGVVELGADDGEQMVVIWEGAIFDIVVNDGAETSADGDYLYASSTAGAVSTDATRSAGAVGQVIRDAAGEPDYVLWWGVPDMGGSAGDVATDTIWDAKGDLAAGTGADTAAKLTVGANDTILMADSAQTTGLKWVASGTPSTQAFGDTASVGTADTFTRGDHKHAMPTAAVTTSGLTQATAKLLGRTSASTGAIEEISVGGGLTFAAGSLSATGGSAVIATDTLWDAKGDLAAGTGADAASRLAVGANGTFLQADSTQSTGLKWSTASSSSVTVGGSLGDVPPASPGTYDEEFEGTADTLPTDWAWTSAPSGSDAWFLNSRWPSMLTVEGTGNTTYTLTRTNFTAAATFGLWAKIRHSPHMAADVSDARMYVANSTSNDWRGVQPRVSSVNVITGRALKKVAAGGEAQWGANSVNLSGQTAFYIGVTRDGSNNWMGWIGTDGIGWILVGTSESHTFTVDRMIFSLKTHSNLSLAGIEWVRYRTDTAFPRL